MTPILPNFEAGIVRRVVDAQRAGWSREAAESILALSLTEADLQRASELAKKSSGGELCEQEQREMATFRHVGRFLELLKSRARWPLKTSNDA